MWISNSTRQRSYFGVQSDRPGRSRVPDYYMNFAKNMFLTFFLKNVNFKFQKTAELFWRPKRPSRTQPSARLLYEFCKNHIFHFFWKKCKFQKTQDSGETRPQNWTVQKRAKIQILFWILKFWIFPIKKKNMPKYELYRVRWIRGAKPGPSQRGQKSGYSCDFW